MVIFLIFGKPFILRISKNYRQKCIKKVLNFSIFCVY